MMYFIGSGSRLLLLLAPQLLLVPLLRMWATSRWARIDWIVNRPARMASRAVGATGL